MNGKQLASEGAKKARCNKGWNLMTTHKRAELVTYHTFQAMVALFESGADVGIEPIDILEMNQAIVLETVDLT